MRRPERALTTATARNYGGAFGRTGARGGRGGAGAHTDCDTLSNRIAVQRNALRPGVSVICWVYLNCESDDCSLLTYSAVSRHIPHDILCTCT